MTTYKKAGEGSAEELYLMRSYRHFKTAKSFPSRVATESSLLGPTRQSTGLTAQNRRDRDGRRKIIYDPSEKHEIWQVARAAASPPLFFKPMPLEIGRNMIDFEDAGMGEYNNPTREALLDMQEQASRGDAVGAVVSIGTAKKDPPNASKRLIPTGKRILDRAADPENVARLVDEMANEHNFSYWRLNADPHHALEIILDDWRPRRPSSRKKEGEDTIDTIDKAFKEWYLVEENREYIKQCARILVRIRQERAASKPKWERFATCHAFNCRQDRCSRNENENKPFFDRSEFEEHLKTDHGFHMGSHDFIEEMEECRKEWEYLDRTSS